MPLTDLLEKQGIDPATVIAMRHSPKEKELRKVLPWLVHERPAVFNAYQQSHGGHQEQALENLVGSGFLASFVALKTGTAVFAGFYQIRAARPVGYQEFWDMDVNQALKSFGLPDWQDLVLTWAELQAIPTKWKDALRQWRGIYFIRDGSDGRGYVGAAYGNENLLGRWTTYASSGDGGNKLLVSRHPNDFQFSILQRVSPDMPADEVIRLESSWKDRLHTRGDFGLNPN